MKKMITLVIVMLFFTLILNAQKYTQLSYIEKYDSISIELMKKYEIPPSIILAISMHESAYGNSSLSRKKHNFFGVKSGNYYKTYENDSTSFEHFCQFISKKKYYNKLIESETKDYKIWLNEIKRGYSQDPNWHSKVLHYIKKYELYKFDFEADNFFYLIITII
jgi:flagellum-specific peptidoglycan hydrolase FlgJ